MLPISLASSAVWGLMEACLSANESVYPDLLLPSLPRDIWHAVVGSSVRP